MKSKNKSYFAVGTAVAFAFASVSISNGQSWTIDSQAEWEVNQSAQENLDFADGLATPNKKTASFQSSIKSFDEKKSAKSITIGQSPIWQNWNPTSRLGPKNADDAPVFLRWGKNDYWIFARYKKPGTRKKAKITNPRKMR